MNRGGDQNQRLLPDLSPIRIVDEVAFIKDDEAQIVKAQGRCEAKGLCFRALFVQKVPEDFGGHDEDLGIGLELDIPCHDADRVVWKLFFEIGELLIRQGFNGIGRKDPLAFAQRLVDGYLSNCGLA